MTDSKGQIGASEEWYLYLPSNEALPQPYRSAPITWPISDVELKRTEAQAQSGNASALNNLGKAQCAAAVRVPRFVDLVHSVSPQVRCISLVGVNAPSTATKRTIASAVRAVPAVRPPPTTELCANCLDTAANRTNSSP